MEFPPVEIKHDEPLNAAAQRVEQAFEKEGAALLAFESLNTLLSTASFCQFFQVDYRSRSCVLVVATQPWDEPSLITVLNVLLEMRVDPDPPGAQPLFKLYSAYSVPGVLLALFGESPASEFEYRSCLVARFGNEMRPEDCRRLAAVAMFLSRVCFSIETSLDDPRGEERIAETVCRYLPKAPAGAEPLNSLIVYGCLYGETLRARLRYPSRWARVGHFDPWPGLLFRSPDGGEVTMEVAFNPIAHVIELYEKREKDGLAAASANLAARCRSAFLAASEPGGAAERGAE